MTERPSWADDQFCYLTTTGRRSGRPHEIEIWFGYDSGVLYLLSGGGRRSDWVANLIADDAVRIRIGAAQSAATARIVAEPGEDARARRLVAAKYQGWSQGLPLSRWARSALVVAVEPQ